MRRVTVRCTPAVREKWSVVCEMAERVAGQRLRAGEVLELVTAEAWSAVSIDPGLEDLEELGGASECRYREAGISQPVDTEQAPAAPRRRARASR